MTKRDIERVARIAKKQNPGMDETEARKLAVRVLECLAERRRPKNDPAWEGCR